MAVTVVQVKKTAVRDLYLHIYKVTFDSSYPTGGEALTAADLGFSDHATLLTVLAFAGGYTMEYDEANAKLLAYWVDTTVDGAAMAEVANTTNLSTVTATVLAFGSKPA